MAQLKEQAARVLHMFEKDPIGQGGHGCVYEGNACGNQSERQLVSKVVPYHEREDDKSYATILNKIDPHQTYFIYYQHRCDLKPEDVARVRLNCKAREILDQRTHMSAIIFTNAGKSVYNSKPQLDWFINPNMLLNVMKGLTMLHSKSLVHGDVTLKNIVCDGISMRLIDFGLMRDRDHIIDSYTAPYAYWPNELQVYHFLKSEILTSASKNLELLMQELVDHDDQTVFPELLKTWESKQHEMKLHIKTILKDPTQFEDFVNIIVNTIDIYMFAINILFIFLNLEISAELKQTSEWKLFEYRLNMWVQKCINVNYVKRYTLDKALQQWTNYIMTAAQAFSNRALLP